MAEPVGKAVLDVIQKDCKSLTCPYRQGDGDSVRAKLKAEVEKKLEYRVADGNTVRVQQKRIKQLETALEKAIKLATHRKLTNKEVLSLTSALLATCKEGT